MDIQSRELPQDVLLEYAALAESASSHPISKSLLRRYGKTPDRSRVTQIREISGHGITALVDGIAVAAGNEKLMQLLQIPCPGCATLGTQVHMALDGRYAGCIVIADVIKPTAQDALTRLRAAGIRQTVMLTGDNAAVAEDIAGKLGID